MITKRHYVAMLLIFFSVFLLFQGFQVSRQYLSARKALTYASLTGADAGEPSPGAADEWTVPDIPGGLGIAGSQDAQGAQDAQDAQSAQDAQGTQGAQGAPGTQEPDLAGADVLYAGAGGTALANTAAQWAWCSRRSLRSMTELALPLRGASGSLLLVDGEQLAQNAVLVAAYLNRGGSAVCMELPDEAAIEASPLLRELLGIRSVEAPSVRLHGIHLLPHFLLGGERVYTEDPEETPESFLALLTVPWYIVRQGTKTYVRGLLDKEMSEQVRPRLKNEDMPAIVWRSHYGAGELYAVNGPYMRDMKLGMGLLEAMSSEMAPYSLYPVVDARAASFVNYPIAADENDAFVRDLYGKSVTKLQNDTILPGVISYALQKGVRPTCYQAAKYDLFGDPAPPQDGIPALYLSMLEEVRGELGISLLRGEGVGPEAALVYDAIYYAGQDTGYPLYAAFMDAGQFSELAAAGSGAAQLRTLALAPDDRLPPVGLADDGRRTWQQATADAAVFTPLDELASLGVGTALGYCHIYCDMARAIWPASEDDQWQSLSSQVMTSLMVYQAPFMAFDSATATECGEKIRAFRTLEHAHSRTGSRISLDISGAGQNASFLLRTHHEEVGDIVGGRSVQLEEDAYLIRAEREHVEIELYPTLTRQLGLKGGAS